MRPPIRRTTVEIGQAFEEHCLSFLNGNLYMSLARVGGANDGGVDLRGWWWLPSKRKSGLPHPASLEFHAEVKDAGRLGGGKVNENTRRVRVLAQCKAERLKLGPKVVREMEGVMAHLRGRELYDIKTEQTRENYESMAVILSQSGFSSAAMQQASRSYTPLLLVHLPGGQPTPSSSQPTPSGSSSPPPSPQSPMKTTPEQDSSLNTRDKQVSGAWWNAALSSRSGILGGQMELRREILDGEVVDEITGNVGVRTRLGLWFDGRRFGRVEPHEG